MPKMRNNIERWRQSLKQAIASGDLVYAMHCDEMITKLKQD